MTDRASQQSMEKAPSGDSMVQNRTELELDVKDANSGEVDNPSLSQTPDAPQQQNEANENYNELPPVLASPLSNPIPQTQIETLTAKQFNNRNRPVRYKGSVRESLPSGSGVLMFEDGSFYDGSFENGKPHGYGRYVSTGGDIVAGYFEKGRCRKGLRVAAAGHAYTGEFHSSLGNGIFDGLGQLRFTNGDVYEGHFRMGRFSGTGKYSFHDGTTVYCSTWENDEPRGMVSIASNDGSYFSGHILRNQQLLEGRAFIRFEDGGWLESQSTDESSKLELDSRSGCTIFDTTKLTKRWRYGLTRPHAETSFDNGLLLVCMDSLPVVSFSTEVPANSDQMMLERTILTIHQHLQFALKSIAKDDQVKWLINDSSDLVAFQSLLRDKHKRALAITKTQLSVDNNSFKEAFAMERPDGTGFYHLISRMDETSLTLRLWHDGQCWDDLIANQKFEAVRPHIILISLEGEWYNVENNKSDMVRTILAQVSCPVLVRIAIPEMRGLDNVSRRFVKLCCSWAVNMLS